MSTPVAPVTPPSKTPEIDKSGPARLMVDKAIQRAIDRAVLPLPDDADTAKVVFRGDYQKNGAAEFGVAYLGRKRLGDGTLTWEIAGVAAVGGDWGKGMKAGVRAEVAYAW